MILHFSDGQRYLNFSGRYENYNFTIYEDTEYISVSPESFNKIYAELVSHGFDHEKKLKLNRYQKLSEAIRRDELKKIAERISNGELLMATHSKNEKTGKRYPFDRMTQRYIIYITMLTYPECNNSEIARMTGASRGTVIQCRKDITNCDNIEELFN